jgi:hypothetical protein
LPRRYTLFRRSDRIGYYLGSVTGTIETDGTIGTIGIGDILDWNLQAQCVEFILCSASNFNLTPNDSSIIMVGIDELTATATQLQYDYGTAGAFLGYFEIRNGSDAWVLGAVLDGLTYEEISRMS